MHTSWLVTVFVRMSTHESVLMRRWAVTSVFALDFTVCPLLQQKGVEVNIAHSLEYSCLLFLLLMLLMTFLKSTCDGQIKGSFAKLLQLVCLSG